MLINRRHRYVLPNHYIFSLAERTPADMAALLTVFHPTPPVIRRRAKELLDAIRDAVKGVLGAPIPANSSVEAAASTRETDAAMSVDEKVEVVATSASSVVPPSLWSNGKHAFCCVTIRCVLERLRTSNADIYNSVRYHSFVFETVRSILAADDRTSSSNSIAELASWWQVRCAYLKLHYCVNQC